jgi:hypothetical protein
MMSGWLPRAKCPSSLLLLLAPKESRPPVSSQGCVPVDSRQVDMGSDHQHLGADSCKMDPRVYSAAGSAPCAEHRERRNRVVSSHLVGWLYGIDCYVCSSLCIAAGANQFRSPAAIPVVAAPWFLRWRHDRPNTSVLRICIGVEASTNATASIVGMLAAAAKALERKMLSAERKIRKTCIALSSSLLPVPLPNLATAVTSLTPIQ